jgi:2-hydroxy-3-keto-5-methylthiopentenyl-1-phosphate phosphatase
MSVLIDGRAPIIFCDYDGTITEEDVIQMVMRTFAPPEWKEIVADILDHRTLSINDGLKQLFALLPSAQRDDITNYVKTHVRFRSGFDDLLAFCAAHEIPFLVVSGGVDFLITPMLERLSAPLELYCNHAHFEAEYIHIETPWAPESCEPCQQCACCKIRILDKYDPDQYYRITIGDSLTDLGMTERADLAFARARLLDYVLDRQLPVTRFECFSDVQAVLASRLVAAAGGVV